MNFGDSLPFLAALVMLLARPRDRQGLGALQAARRQVDRSAPRARSHHYVLGLNFLVANQIDLAIEELSQAARVDSDALEIHLILGNVHRERGQVARAIQVHQALLQRPKLTRIEHAYILLCLGLDFKRGGFVDRALEAFNEVHPAWIRRTSTRCSTCRSCTRSSISGPTRTAFASSSSR